jgi:hypothetical protein
VTIFGYVSVRELHQCTDDSVRYIGSTFYCRALQKGGKTEVPAAAPTMSNEEMPTAPSGTTVVPYHFYKCLHGGIAGIRQRCEMFSIPVGLDGYYCYCIA